MIRVSSFSQNQMLQSNMLTTQAQVSDRTIQVSSGKVTQEYTGIASQSLELVSLERDSRRAEQFDRNINTAQSRLGIIETNLGIVTDRVTNLLSDILNGLNGSNIEEIPFDQFAQSFLEEVVGLLNVQHENRYLFSGSLTNTPPVDITDAAYTPQAGLPGTFTADFDYYQGDDVKLTTRIDDDATLTYGITADDPAFEQLLRGLSYAEYAGVNKDKDVLQESYDLLQSALDGLSALRSQVGAQSKVLEGAAQAHTDYRTYVDNTISTIEDVDVAEAMSRLSFDKVQLQASYMSISQINQTNLLSFIR